MKAIVWTAYGSPDVLQLREVPKPVPADNEVLVRIHAATVSTGDCEARQMSLASWISVPFRLYIGLRRPSRVTVLGQELAGEIEAAGKDVSRFKPGDPVFGTTGLRLGAHAEYTRVPATHSLALKPDGVSYEDAATLPVGGINALHFMRKAAIKPGEQVLINGAGGSIGTYAVQLAKRDGAEVTAVDSGDKLEMLRSIGADRVIDYTREDFTASGLSYDVIFDVVGKSPFSRCMAILRPNGRYLNGNPGLSMTLRRGGASKSTGKQVIAIPAEVTPEDLGILAELVAAGALRAVIDRRFPLAETAEAHRYLETGRKAGHVVITVVDSPQI